MLRGDKTKQISIAKSADKEKLRGSLVAMVASGQLFSIPEESHPKAAKVCKYPSSEGHCHPTAVGPSLSPTEKQQRLLQPPKFSRFHTHPWAKRITFGVQAAPDWNRRGSQLLSLCFAELCDGKRISAHARKGPGKPPGRAGMQALHGQLQQAMPPMPLWGNFFSG